MRAVDYLGEKRRLRVLDIEQEAYGLYYNLDPDNESWVIARGTEILLEVPRTWTAIDILTEDETVTIYFKLVYQRIYQRSMLWLKE